MGRFAATIALVVLGWSVALLPARPVLESIWPPRVDEIVLADGQWVLQSAAAPGPSLGAAEVLARSRPLSLLAVRHSDGSLRYGFVLQAPDSREDGLLLLTAPDREVQFSASDIEARYHPNALNAGQRARLAIVNLFRRTPSRR